MPATCILSREQYLPRGCSDQPTGEKNREYQDQPNARPLCPLNGCNAQEGDFGRGVKTETEAYPQWIHLPRSRIAVRSVIIFRSEHLHTHRSISLNVFLNRLKRQPAPCISNFCSSPGAVPISFLICLTSLYKMYIFKIPRIIRKEAETDVPTIPPTLLKESNLSLMAEAVAATTTHVMITMLKAAQYLHLQRSSEVVT